MADVSELDSQSPVTIALAERERLGIKHFLVWSALCGVYLAAMRQLGLLSDHLGMQDSYRISQVLWCFAGGATLGMPFIWWRSRRSGQSFPHHPGEWLWFLLFLRLVLALAYAAATIQIIPQVFAGDPTAALTMRRIVACLDLLIAVVGVWFVRHPRRWRVFMCLLLLPSLNYVAISLAPITWSLQYAQSTISDIANYGFAYGLPLLALVMGLYDWRVKSPWPWTHWVGIGIIVWELPVNILAACVWHWTGEVG